MNFLTIQVVTFTQQKASIQAIRYAVFQQEQGVPPELEFDGKDEDAQHLLAFLENKPVGTARIRYLEEGVAKIERLAVLPFARGQGIGQQLMEKALETATKAHCLQVVINAQEYIQGLYQKIGFMSVGEPFQEAGITHIKMVKTLIPTFQR